MLHERCANEQTSADVRKKYGVKCISESDSYAEPEIRG